MKTTLLINVHDEGKKIKVLDGTVYKICPKDTSNNWGQGNMLAIHEDTGDNEYPYIIVNPTKSQWVRGKVAGV